MLFNHSVIDWLRLQDIQGWPAIWIPDLLDRLERQPSPQLWQDLRKLLVVEGESPCRASFAALPGIAVLAGRGTPEDLGQALGLAGDIARSLHRYRDADDLVRAAPDAFATLFRLASGSLPGLTGAGFCDRFQAALAFAGYTFWAVISLDYSDEHYQVTCPRCAQEIVVVIGQYGHYSAIRHWSDGDVERCSLRSADPAALTGIARWMHDTATANGEMTLANGLTYLFGDANCPRCGTLFNVANRYEAENSPPQPIDPIAPR